ncbi:MAG TPA: alpha/beta hydrolase-fold protein [Bryobacteraceae bacterium]|jgi:enterochelin esterase family protein
MKTIILWLSCASAVFAQSPADWIEAARKGPAGAEMKERAAKLTAPTQVQVWGQDYLFLATAPQPVTVSIDLQPQAPLAQVDATHWMLLRKMRTGALHQYQFYSDGKPLGNRGDAVGYNPDSYPQPGIPRGKLSEQMTITSKLYDGMKANYWVYASAGVDPNVPSALMVWQDGQNLIREFSGMRLMAVTDNLVHQGLLPPIVHVMIQPGTSPEGRAMRSIEYDTVSNRYPRFLMEEVLPEVEKMYKLRQDGYSRAIAGESSGGICAFNAAWYMPDKFARVHSAVGSFTSIQWRSKENNDGGNVYPFMVRKEPKRNIRVWMSDGADDLENNHGSWPMQNIQMANSLKFREYDFHFRFGTAAHGGAQASLDLPESLAWLWRDYDPKKTAQDFTIDPAEKEKPFFRVSITNRDAW